MHRYEILPHTADERVRAVGSDREELLRAAMQGMFSAADPEYIEPPKKAERSFSVQSHDFNELVVDVLNEALYHSDTNYEAYDDIRFTRCTDTEAEGIFLGRAVSKFGTQIKAATRFDFEVKQDEEGNLEATITFDA